MPGRRLVRGLLDALGAVPLFATAPLYRRRHLRWGATDAEVRAAMPGDDVVPRPSFAATRAVTVEAPPARVWPWIVQMGWGRAGFYTYPLLDNGGRESADQILPDWQHPVVGDRMPMAPTVTDATAFTVTGLEPEAWLLWQKPDSTWAWRLTPLPAGRTRLVTRLRAAYDWRHPARALLSLVLLEFGDWPMTRRMLRGITSRAERTTEVVDDVRG